MDRLFWGFFFLFLSFNLKFNGASLDLLPDWVGYLLLYRGCSQLLGESELFQKPRPFCLGLGIYAGILWLMDLFGISANFLLVSWLLGFVSTCLDLYTSMLVVDAITNVEMRRNYDLCAAHLRKVWKVLAVCTVAAYILTILPALAVVCVLLAAITGIVFLVAIHGTRKAWRNMLHEQSNPF